MGYLRCKISVNRFYRSQEGQGSQFTLVIPSRSPQNALPPERPPGKGEEWVLVMDAIAKTLEAWPSLLTDLGYGVMIARTEIEGVEKARRFQPKFIFLNPDLPLLSGWDVLTLLKSAAETRYITIILTEKPIELTAISPISPFNHRILEADDLDQAEMLTQVWEVDGVGLDGRALNRSRDYLIALSQCPHLATLPLIIFELSTAEIANQIPGLTVFPCLLLDENPA